MLNLPEGSEPSGEADQGNDKVRIDLWNVLSGQKGALSANCTVTCLSPSYTIQQPGLYASVAESLRTAIFAIVGPTNLQVGEPSISLTATTELYDPNVEGHLIDSLIYGHVMVDNKTSELFAFEKKFVLGT